MTKYLKIVLFAVIGIMFSGIAEAAITPINEAENDLKFGSRKKGELKCDNRIYLSSPIPNMDCKIVTLSDNKTQCFSCTCPLTTYPYTDSNCKGERRPVTTESYCTDKSTGTKHYKSCECVDKHATYNESTRKCECNDDFELYNGVCKEKCTNGTARSGDGSCSSCVAEDAHYDNSSAQCKCDDSKKELRNGLCICKAIYDAVDGNCLAKCPAGIKRDANDSCTVCIDETKEYVDGECVTRCPEHATLIDGECQCNSGYEMVNNVCELAQTSGNNGCPEGASEKNGVCVCDDATRELWTDEETGETSCKCKDGYYDDPFDGEDKCIVDPNSDVMQCPVPSVLDEETGECICEDDGICTINCKDGKYEICGYFTRTSTGEICTTWDAQKNMWKCDGETAAVTTTEYLCVTTETTCEVPCANHIPDGHICTQSTINGKTCYTDCVPSICGTGYISEGEHIVYDSTHKMIAIKQSGKYYNPYTSALGSFTYDDYQFGKTDEFTEITSTPVSSLSALEDYKNASFWATGGCSENSGMMWIGKNGKLECKNKSTTTASHLIYLTPCTCPTDAQGSLEEKTIYSTYNCKVGQYYSGSGYNCSSTSDKYLVASLVANQSMVAVNVNDLASSEFAVTGDVFEQTRADALRKCSSGDVLSASEYENIADDLKTLWPNVYNNSCIFLKTGHLVRTSDNALCSGSTASALASNGCSACVSGDKIKARVICKKDFLSKSTTTKYSKCTCPSGQIYDGATGECVDYCPNKGTQTYCDSTKYNCQYEECSGKYIVSCGSYFNKSGTPSCPSDRIVDKCSVNNYKYACATCEEAGLYRGEAKTHARLTLNGRVSQTRNGQSQQYSVTAYIFNLCGEQVAKVSASYWNISPGISVQTSSSDNPIPAGDYYVELATSLSNGPYSVRYNKLSVDGTDYRSTGISGRVKVNLMTSETLSIELSPEFY